MTSRQDDPPRPGLARRLTRAAALIENVGSDTPVVVQLAQAWNGFFIARTVTVLLDAEAVPHRDVYRLAEYWCTQALEALYDTVGSKLVHRYASDHTAGLEHLEQLAAAGEAELLTATDTDLDRIAAAMVELTAQLRHLLTRVTADETALPGQRTAASAALTAAANIWSHYGGDSGGW